MIDRLMGALPSTSGGTSDLAWLLVWQSTLWLAVGLLAARVWRRRAGRAHLLLVLAMGAAFVSPLLTVIVHRMQWGFLPAPPEPPTVVVTRTEVSAPLAEVHHPDNQLPRGRANSPDEFAQSELDSMPGRGTSAIEPEVAASEPPAREQPQDVETTETAGALPPAPVTWTSRVTAVLAASWSIASLLLMVRLAISLFSGTRIVRTSREETNPQLVAALGEATRALGLRGAPSLRLAVHSLSDDLVLGSAARRIAAGYGDRCGPDTLAERLLPRAGTRDPPRSLDRLMGRNCSHRPALATAGVAQPATARLPSRASLRRLGAGGRGRGHRLRGIAAAARPARLTVARLGGSEQPRVAQAAARTRPFRRADHPQSRPPLADRGNAARACRNCRCRFRAARETRRGAEFGARASARNSSNEPPNFPRARSDANALTTINPAPTDSRAPACAESCDSASIRRRNSARPGSVAEWSASSRRLRARSNLRIRGTTADQRSSECSPRSPRIHRESFGEASTSVRRWNPESRSTCGPRSPVMVFRCITWPQVKRVARSRSASSTKSRSAAAFWIYRGSPYATPALKSCSTSTRPPLGSSNG